MLASPARDSTGQRRHRQPLPIATSSHSLACHCLGMCASSSNCGDGHWLRSNRNSTEAKTVATKGQ
eukprot:165130-Alexandrium_andersonii.AAC.1